jgi:hypothetical protein
MVGEFPELQGIMGGYYARHDGLRDGVAIAIEDHYKPRFAGDALPRNHTGTVLALADKLETLVGLFGIGQLPTGDKDPFALRRHALGVIRMLVEKNLPLDLPALIARAGLRRLIQDRRGAAGLLHDRLAGCASRATAPRKWMPCWRCARSAWARCPRLEAVRAFAALPEAAALAAANKRVGNILKKVEAAAHGDAALLQEAAEQALAAALAESRRRPTPLRGRRLHRLAAGPGGAEGAGGRLLRRRDGQCRGPGPARQPPGPAQRPARGDEPRGRPVAPGELRPCRSPRPSSSSSAATAPQPFREDHVKEPEELEPIPGAGGRGPAQPCRLACGAGHQPGRHRPRPGGHGLAQRGAPAPDEDAGGQGRPHRRRFFCPHAPEEACDCRKPQPGMMFDIARRYGVDLKQVPMVADTLRDLQAAQAAGCPPHLIKTGRAAEVTEDERAQWVAVRARHRGA